MADHDYGHGGWKDKYVIFKKCPHCNGQGRDAIIPGHRCDKCCHGLLPVDPASTYFVLRLDEDPHARVAAVAYANSVQRENPQFAMDIREKLAQTHKQEFET